MQLHNLLTTQKDEAKMESLLEDRLLIQNPLFDPPALVKKSKSKPLSVDRGGENLVKEIQAMIISQEMQRRNKAKLTTFGGHNAQRFLADPRLNEHKTIEEKFKRREYNSLAVDLYKSKLQNNPMRQPELASCKMVVSAGRDKENMPAIYIGSIKHESKRKHGLMQLKGDVGTILTPNVNQKAIAPLGLLPLASKPKQSFHQQTLSSQYRTFHTAKSFDQPKYSFQGMPSVRKNSVLASCSTQAYKKEFAIEGAEKHGNVADMSLAQIVQLGKSRQRDLVQSKKGQKESSRRAQSYEAAKELRRRIEVHEQLTEREKQMPVVPADEEMETIQTNLTLGGKDSKKRNSTASNYASTSSQRSASHAHTRFFNRGDVIDTKLAGHQTATSGLRGRIFMTQNNRQQNQTNPLDASNAAEATLSEVSLSHPAIISQSGAGHRTSHIEPEHVRARLMTETGLPAIYVKLFIARQKDLQLSRNIELQLARFAQLVFSQSLNKLVLREQGFGSSSAKTLAKILRKSETLTILDLSLNNLDKGLKKLVAGIIDNQSLVAVTLRNNNIDGRRFQQEIFDMIYEHRSLASLNLGNTLSVKNRNRIHNDGLSAIVQAIIASKSSSLLQELYLSNGSITAKGLECFSMIRESGVQFDLQILDLSHNDLGDETSNLIECVLPKLQSLNLSHTKMGPKGAFALAQQLKFAHKSQRAYSLRCLDLSYNHINTGGFLKIMSRLKKSTTLMSINFAGNELKEVTERFESLEKFLIRNESCSYMNLSDCRLSMLALARLGNGLTRNKKLVRLILQMNDIADREAVQHIVRGMLDNSEGSQLTEVDLSKNKLTSESVLPFVTLFEQNYKIRSVNLRYNAIGDDGAQLLLQAIINNSFITKISLDMNPLKHSIMYDIEKHTHQNLHNVNQQEVPQMIEEILDVKKKTAQSLYDCVEDPLIRDKIPLMMHPSRLSNLRRVSSRGGSFHRRTTGPVPKHDQDQLLKNKFFASSDVVAITDEIKTQLKSLVIDKQQTFALYKENETMKEKMLEEDNAMYAKLRQETCSLLDIKREKEFEVIMLDEASKTEESRALQRIADVQHRIELIKLKQEKIKSQIKEIYKERGIKDDDQDLVKKAFEKEYEKIMRKLNITKIIHETYIKELDRFHKSELEAKRKRQESEERRIAEAELARLQELAAADEERRRLLLEQRRLKAAQKRAAKQTTRPRKTDNSRDIMGMNSPRKAARSGDSRTINQLSIKPIKFNMKKVKTSLENKKLTAKQPQKKCIGSHLDPKPTPLPQQPKTTQITKDLHAQIQTKEEEKLQQQLQPALVQSRSVGNSLQMDADQKAEELSVFAERMEPKSVSESVEGSGDEEDDSSFKEFIKTDIDQQEQEQGDLTTHKEQSFPSVKIDKEHSFDTYSHIRGQDTTAGASIKMAAGMLSNSNLQQHLAPPNRAKVMLQSAHAAHNGNKNFQDIEEIPADEHSMLVKDVGADTSSHGRWSSDIHDETMTVMNSVLNEPAGQPAGITKMTSINEPSAFEDQHRV